MNSIGSFLLNLTNSAYRPPIPVPPKFFSAAFIVRAIRSDGFDKPIQLEAKNLPPGFEMSKAIISEKSDTIRFTITAPKEISEKTISPQITGIAFMDERPITRSAIPVDDTMQAFLYRHLVPAQELVLVPVGQPPSIIFEIDVPVSGVI